MSGLAQNGIRGLRRLKRQLACLLARRFERCSRLIPITEPILAKHYKSDERRFEHLVIFLPGIGDLPEDYEINGFIDAVRRREIPVDMTVADLHFGYYLTRTAVERLRGDLVVPARKMGYRRISLAGISLGGFGALYYAMHYPEDISHMFLMAPYLGQGAIIEEISGVGGARQWQCKEIVDTDYERKLWAWLKHYTEGDKRFPRLYLGYGLQDRFAKANELLAQLLPAQRTYTIDGRHNWGTWRRLWNRFLNDKKSDLIQTI